MREHQLSFFNINFVVVYWTSLWICADAHFFCSWEFWREYESLETEKVQIFKKTNRYLCESIMSVCGPHQIQSNEKPITKRIRQLTLESNHTSLWPNNKPCQQSQQPPPSPTPPSKPAHAPAPSAPPPPSPSTSPSSAPPAKTPTAPTPPTPSLATNEPSK